MVMSSHKRTKKGKLHIHDTYGENWGGPGQMGPKRTVRRAKASRYGW